MKPNCFKTLAGLLVFASYLCMAACSDDKDDNGAYDGWVQAKNIRQSECFWGERGGYRAVASVESPHAMLRIDRSADTLHCTLYDYEMCCSATSAKVFYIVADGRIDIRVDQNLGDIAATCLCQFNLSFDVVGVGSGEYQLTLDDKSLGALSFGDDEAVEIDTETLERRENPDANAHVSVSQLLANDIAGDGVNREEAEPYAELCNRYSELAVQLYNIVVPKDYADYHVTAHVDGDTLTVVLARSDTDGAEAETGLADVYFYVAGITREMRHLRLAQATDGGSEATLYDDDVDVHDDEVLTLDLSR